MSAGFDRDIHGRAWAPCAGCPHPAPGRCASRRHRAYCDHHARDPATWGPILAAQPAEDRPPRPGPYPTQPARPAPIRQTPSAELPPAGAGPCPHHVPGPVPGKCPRWFLCAIRKVAVTADTCGECDLV